MKGRLINLRYQQKKKITEEKRIRKNISIFIIMYFFMGILRGIDGDSLMSYLHLNTPKVSSEITICIGISLILLVLMLIIIRWIGIKKVLIALILLIAISFLGLIEFKSNSLAMIFITFVELGNKAFLVIIPLALMAYINKNQRIKLFSKAVFLHVLGMAVASFLDGKIVVYRFKELLGVNYKEASDLTTNLKNLNRFQFHQYINSYKFVIWILFFITIILLVLTLIIKEKREDYRGEKIKIEKINFNNVKNLKWKYIIVWIIFSCLIAVDDNLLLPHVPVYLNRVLHISRGTTSTLISLESLGMMFFVMSAPWLIKKIGRIKHFSIFLLISTPLMILMGIGGIFGNYIILVMGIIMFVRWGATHSYYPTMSILPLTFVEKENRPLLTALITLISGIFSLIIGMIGKKYIFNSINCYNKIFFIIAIIYVFAAIIIFVTYNKEYDKFDETI